MVGWVRSAAMALVMVSSASFAAEPQPSRAPVPSWVKPIAIPAADPSKKSAPIQILLIGGQTRIASKGMETYFEMVMQPQTVAGVQGAGTVSIPWNVDQTDLTFHAIEIHRDGKVVDLLKGAQFTILRREENLDRAQIDGVRTVVLPVRGLEVGDALRVAATYVSKNKLGERPEDLSDWAAPFDMVSLDRRILIADGANVKWRFGNPAIKPVVTKIEGWTEYRLVGSNLKKEKYPAFMRPRDKRSDIQFTTYQSWGEVAGEGQLLYRAARKLSPTSPLAAEVAKIAAANSAPSQRMLAALRFAQERVRYVALLLGEGAWTPTAADVTWEQRFGDCKAKSAMLLAMLDQLGIQAEALYVSAANGDLLSERLPSLRTFDHVIVKATIDGKPYYLDATDYGQRTLADVSASTLSYGLPLVAGGTLEPLPPIVTTVPTKETETIWNGTKGVTGDVPFTVKMTLRGVNAIKARATIQTSATVEKTEDYFKSLVPGLSNDVLNIVSHGEDEASGEYIVKFDGKADMQWDEYADRKGLRFAFDNDASTWEVDFEREEGPYKDARVLISQEYWQRDIETVILPDTKGFRVDDIKPIDVKAAGTHIWRSVVMGSDRVTATSNFRPLVSDVSANEARAAGEVLEDINENWAYVVAPKSLRLPKKPAK